MNAIGAPSTQSPLSAGNFRVIASKTPEGLTELRFFVWSTDTEAVRKLAQDILRQAQDRLPGFVTLAPFYNEKLSTATWECGHASAGEKA